MDHILSGSTVASQCKNWLINAIFVITPFPLCKPSLPLQLYPKRMTWQAPLRTDLLPASRGSKKLHSTLSQYCCAHVWQCLLIPTTLRLKPTDVPFKGILSSPAAELVQCHLVAFLNPLILGKKHVWILINRCQNGVCYAAVVLGPKQEHQAPWPRCVWTERQLELMPWAVGANCEDGWFQTNLTSSFQTAHQQAPRQM